MLQYKLFFLVIQVLLVSNFIDYIIADKIIIPKEKQEYYSEKIIYLPDTWLVNDYNDTTKNVDIKFSREELGLPKDSLFFQLLSNMENYSTCF